MQLLVVFVGDAGVGCVRGNLRDLGLFFNFYFLFMFKVYILFNFKCNPIGLIRIRSDPNQIRSDCKVSIRSD